jgi:Mrp family chromosome partitioning ATPase
LSKIFDAYRMKTAEKAAVDPRREVAGAGSIALFPRPKPQQQEEFNRLAQRTLSLKTPGRGAVIALASSTSGEGASYVSFQLAMSLAQVYGQKVAWVDANFLSPQAALDRPGIVSLGSLLEDPGSVSHFGPVGNPFLIAGGRKLMGARGLVAAKNYNDVLEGLGAIFDFVILDLPPALDSSETGLMAQAANGLLLVIEQKFLKWEIVEHGVELLKNKGVNVLGTVINRREFALPKLIYDRL